MSDSNELAPFKLTKDLYQTTVEFSASEAELMLRYAEYCLANNIVVPEDGAANDIDYPFLMKALVARVAGGFIEHDDAFADWLKKNKDEFFNVNLEEYFSVKRARKNKKA